ncbi:hypothetical protein KAJ27_13850, partial [bacterium]|nr:hypothetical protein [bacterium]
IEAACMGTSVLFYDESSYKYDNFLNSIGKDSLWTFEKNSKTISEQIEHLLQFRQEHPEKLITDSYKLRNLLFNECTDKNIADAFELD